ncbi:hypothetical protein BH10ACI1_BH10ACI1_17900 [soil metagenome]
MPTTITEVIDEERGKRILRVEGDLTEQDAILLEKIALDLRGENEQNLTIDLADLDFLDSDSAAILQRMQRAHGFEIEGMEIFLQSAVNQVEKRSA